VYLVIIATLYFELLKLLVLLVVSGGEFCPHQDSQGCAKNQHVKSLGKMVKKAGISDKY
jgi:hypothetical protein